MLAYSPVLVTFNPNVNTTYVAKVPSGQDAAEYVIKQLVSAQENDAADLSLATVTLIDPKEGLRFDELLKNPINNDDDAARETDHDELESGGEDQEAHVLKITFPKKRRGSTVESKITVQLNSDAMVGNLPDGLCASGYVPQEGPLGIRKQETSQDASQLLEKVQTVTNKLAQKTLILQSDQSNPPDWFVKERLYMALKPDFDQIFKKEQFDRKSFIYVFYVCLQKLYEARKIETIFSA